MDCIAWMANVINENIQLIEQEERWYEDTSGHNLMTKYFTLTLVIMNDGVNTPGHANIQGTLYIARS
jgi:hypothetical protein